MIIYGPGDNDDNTIAEIGLDEILEGILPGSEPHNNTQSSVHENDNTSSGIDDPFSF